MKMSDRHFTALGVDVGGTKTDFGVVTFPEGVLKIRRTIPTLPDRGSGAVLAEVEQVAAEMIATAAATSHVVDAIGLGICELVNQSGEILSANCIDWLNLKVSERLSALAPAIIEADVRAAALAEALFGAGRDTPTFLYVSIGTGIASCLVIDGKPYTGSRGATGTMASGPMPRIDSIQRCSPSATLEQVASGPALVARSNALLGNAHSAQDVLAAAAAGDLNACNVIISAARTLGGSIGWLINVLDPELVILGGGLGSIEGLYREQLVAAARSHIWWEGHRYLPVVSAQTGTDAGLIGAAACAWQRFCLMKVHRTA